MLKRNEQKEVQIFITTGYNIVHKFESLKIKYKIWNRQYRISGRLINPAIV